MRHISDMKLLLGNQWNLKKVTVALCETEKSVDISVFSLTSYTKIKNNKKIKNVF